MKRILIIGASSAIAKAAARRWAAQGARLFLVARRADALPVLASDLRVRGAAHVDTRVLDVNDIQSHVEVMEHVDASLDGIDIALIAHGTLSDQAACQADVGLTLHEISTNALSVIALCTHLANKFEAQGGGQLVVIGSVAGERGRASNYVYGTAKGAVAIFLQGLRQRLHKSGVNVLTIKPGFVDTPMTQAFTKGPLWSTPETAGLLIVRAVERRADVAYVPGFWRIIMLVVRTIPERLFKRLSL